MRSLFAEDVRTAKMMRRNLAGSRFTSLMFNPVVQHAMEKDIRFWRMTRGLESDWEKGRTQCISADDVMLVDTSLHQLRTMMMDFARSTTKHNPPGHNQILINQCSNKPKAKEVLST